MELKLNVYKQGQIEKTYVAETYDLMFGTLEDIINIIDLDALKSTDNGEFISAVAKIIVKGFDQFKPLLKDIFPGLTDDELRRVKVSEIVPVVLNVIQYTFTEMMPGGTRKNK